MFLDDFKLSLIKTARLFENVVRYAYLAEIMEQSALLQDLEFLFIKTEKLAKQH